MSTLNFEDFNFEVINVEDTGELSLTVNLNSVSVTRAIAELLNYPSHVKPLIDRKERVFAIQACKSSTSKAINFSKPESKQKGTIKLLSSAIRNSLRATMKDSWKDSMRYQITGTFIPEHKAFVFDLKESTELQPLHSKNKN
jgi:hypothetical protein